MLPGVHYIAVGGTWVGMGVQSNKMVRNLLRTLCPAVLGVARLESMRIPQLGLVRKLRYKLCLLLVSPVAVN